MSCLDLFTFAPKSGTMDALHVELNENPLQDAVRDNEVNDLRKLLDSHPVNETDQYELTALHWACDYSHEECVQVLLAAGADVNAIENTHFKRQPIHFAALRGSVSIMKLLHANGADINAKDGIGRTPLHCAAHAGAVDAITWLLDNDADLFATTKDKHTALDLAKLNCQNNVVELLDNISV
ncbi:unnamed protein product [Aphanomyces euteiches]